MPQDEKAKTAEQLIAELDTRRADRTPGAERIPDGPEDQSQSRAQDNALLDLARRGELTADHLRRLVVVEAQCQRAELAAYGLMTARFPHPRAVGLYQELIRLVHGAQPALADCAEALGLSRDGLRTAPQAYRTYAFNGMLSWIALQGSQAATALAVHSDLVVYLGGCVQVVRAVRESGVPAPEEFLAYYGAGCTPELLGLAQEAVDEGLRRGDDSGTAVHMAWLLEQSVGDFWRAAAGTDTAAA
ncbi:hypothetical protein QR77_01860 [Streptomyces sp. 150FB]|uniref:hypothetical protein n=1 Tax=Streptomyces sp. 150FB TaxID=1576605 RepID=UPI00058964A6|nr:hypothetical protein [Streptomyces sp. 150FB]KIF73077.1 hypothetical protein QR77_01860 [Streptomyces sp. 150FB]